MQRSVISCPPSLVAGDGCVRLCLQQENSAAKQRSITHLWSTGLRHDRVARYSASLHCGKKHKNIYTFTFTMHENAHVFAKQRCG